MTNSEVGKFKCYCGFYHYNLSQWSKVHGESKTPTNPWIQVPFADDQIWYKQEHDYTQPLPLITHKWICKFCVNLKTKGHKEECDYLKI